MAQHRRRLRNLWTRITSKLHRRAPNSVNDIPDQQLPDHVEPTSNQSQNVQQSNNNNRNDPQELTSVVNKPNHTSTSPDAVPGFPPPRSGPTGGNHPLSPFSAVPIDGHTHFHCSRCSIMINYDIWNSCAKNSHPNHVPRPGPCNHCVQAGEEVKTSCKTIRCERCIGEQGMASILKVRDQALVEMGYVRRLNGVWELPGYPGKWGRPPWDLVRCGFCTDKKLFPQRVNLDARYKEL
ncbi:hypothetical protein ONS96_001168 [Cadophora gregata f. sp. sojae]|nr:hypothetical protein ONS96_001168 [Cadophora gregata f. sp. sojae]